MNRPQILYQFSRSKVEGGDFTHFLSCYGLDHLPRGRPLREMMNTMTFMIDGFDADSRELHSIPEVRQFYRRFHEAWPHWLYFCNLDSDALRVMVLSSLPSITALKTTRSQAVTVEYDPLELLRFLEISFQPMNVMADRAGVSEVELHQRTRAIFLYFNLPCIA